MYLDSEMNEEIIEALRFTVNSGYYDEAAISEIATDCLTDIFESYDLSIPSQETIALIIEEIKKFRVNDSEQKNYQRLQEIFDQLNQEGIIAIDFAGYTISEGHEEVDTVFAFMKKNNLPRKGYCFYHQQDIERSMNDKKLFLAYHSLNGDEKSALKIGEYIVDLLVKANFKVEWDGSLDQRISILDFIWDKKFDDELVGSERAIEQIKKANGY